MRGTTAYCRPTVATCEWCGGSVQYSRTLPSNWASAKMHRKCIVEREAPYDPDEGPLSQEEIARRFRIQKSRVSQIEKTAIAKLMARYAAES